MQKRELFLSVFFMKLIYFQIQKNRVEMYGLSTNPISEMDHLSQSSIQLDEGGGGIEKTFSYYIVNRSPQKTQKRSKQSEVSSTKSQNLDSNCLQNKFRIRISNLSDSSDLSDLSDSSDVSDLSDVSDVSNVSDVSDLWNLLDLSKCFKCRITLLFYISGQI